MSTTGSTVDAVRGMILDGRFAPGARLGEADLAEAVGVSRTPVREALRHLAAEGLVEITPNKGARVVEWTQAELEQVFDLRAEVEGLAARLAAQRASSAQLDGLARIAAAHLLATEAGQGRDLDLLYRLNSEFHGAVVSAVGGSSFPAVLGSLVHTAVLVRTLHTFDEAAMLRSAHHHVELVAAMRARDPLWAESVMRSHLLSARASLLGPRADHQTASIARGA